MRATLQGWFCVFVLASNALAQDWAKAMFDRTSHDFGVVARGANVEHRFKLKNIYVEDVHIASVRSTCGCTNARATQQLLKTYETAEIIAPLDTQKYVGQKDVTVTVVFDKPFPAEVPLRLSSFIRQDVVFEPGAVRFGSVLHGQPARAKVAISYAGRSDWKITAVQANSSHLEATLSETGRAAGKVNYDLWVVLKGTAPPGALKDQLVLATNDRNAQTARILLTVDAMVVSGSASVTAGPSPLLLGALSPGETVRRNLVVRGKDPFRILEIIPPDARWRVQRPDDAKAVHVIPVALETGQQAGPVAGKFRIRTDAPGAEVLEVTVDGNVAAPP